MAVVLFSKSWEYAVTIITQAKQLENFGDVKSMYPEPLLSIIVIAAIVRQKIFVWQRSGIILYQNFLFQSRRHGTRFDRRALNVEIMTGESTEPAARVWVTQLRTALR